MSARLLDERTALVMARPDKDSPLRVHRHGSYGVKVPLVTAS